MVSDQLQTDLLTPLQEIIQEKYHQQLFSVLIPALEDPEPRYCFFFTFSRLES
jgi:hypothetical protein